MFNTGLSAEVTGVDSGVVFHTSYCASIFSQAQAFTWILKILQTRIHPQENPCQTPVYGGHFS
jgi:hypothetical protein